jgi:tryptophan synthase alpha chain
MGIVDIHTAFARAKESGRAAFMPYFSVGYPSLDMSAQIIQAIALAGADLIELGIPFSDPLADGPTIQRSTQIALEQGASVAGCLQIVRQLRQAGVYQPLLLMGYINPILAYGIARFTRDAAEAGADGLIVPDLPPEEGGPLSAACLAHDLALVYLVAPTSTPERIVLAASASQGFLYLVSVTGVTGERDHLPADLVEFVQRVRQHTSLPLAVGFGIATPAQASAVGQVADGVIVGSALIRAVQDAVDPCATAAAFTTELVAAL